MPEEEKPEALDGRGFAAGTGGGIFPFPLGALAGTWQSGYGPAATQPASAVAPGIAAAAFLFGREIGATSTDADADGARDEDSMQNPPGPV